MGCGAGHLSFTVAPYVKQVTSLDLSADMLKVVSETASERGLNNIAIHQASVTKLPFQNHHFDCVMTRFSAHHWTNIQLALSEIRRVLKPNGKFILVDVIAPNSALCDTYLQTVELLRDVSHVRDYSAKEWKDLLNHEQFSIINQTEWKIDIDFKTWVKRMKTPDQHIKMIQTLSQNISHEVRDYFQIKEDASFKMDVIMFEATNF